MSVADWFIVDGELRPFKDGRPVEWAPQPGSQEAFLECPIFECLYEGNRGGGKTQALLVDFGQFVGKGWGSDWKGILFRQTYPQLADVIEKSKQLIPKIWPGARYHEQQAKWVWPTGEILYFRHMARVEDYNNYHGHGYPWIGWEELTAWADDGCYRRMMSCCRSARPGMPRHYRATTNPYGSGFNWVKDRFRLPLAPGKMMGPTITTPCSGCTGRGYKGGEEGIEATPCSECGGSGRGEPRVSIRSKLSENRVLLHADPGYIRRLRESAKNAAELAAWIEGSWDIVAGGMFDDIWLSCKNNIIVPPFRVPSSWRIDRSFDWGSSKPFSVGWWAVSDGTELWLPKRNKPLQTVRGDLFRIHEWYGWNGERNQGLRMNAQQIARGIVQRDIDLGFVGKVRRGIADASIFDVENDNCIAYDMEKSVEINGVRHKGVYFDPADKRSGSRKQGWEQMRKMLAATKPESPDKPREHPGLFVTSGCEHFIYLVPSMPRDEKDPDDVDTNAEDHVADEVRYRCRKEIREIRSKTTFGAH